MDKCTFVDKLRGPRIYGLSIMDWVTSFLGAFLIGHFIFRLKGTIIWITYLILWVLFGIAIHWYYGVDTTLAYYLGISNKPISNDC